MTDAQFARNVGNGFIAIKDHEPMNGDHYIRADHITAIRPIWNIEEEWIGSDVFTLDGSKRRVNASFEQIMDAITNTV